MSQVAFIRSNGVLPIMCALTEQAGIRDSI